MAGGLLLFCLILPYGINRREQIINLLVRYIRTYHLEACIYVCMVNVILLADFLKKRKKNFSLPVGIEEREKPKRKKHYAHSSPKYLHREFTFCSAMHPWNEFLAFPFLEHRFYSSPCQDTLEKMDGKLPLYPCYEQNLRAILKKHLLFNQVLWKYLLRLLCDEYSDHSVSLLLSK